MAAAQIHAEFGDDCDLYMVLGVERTASNKEITRAYRKLALRCHPDKHRGDEQSRAEMTAKFQAVCAVHAILSDQEARAVYDETGTLLAADSDDKSPSYQMWAEYFARIFPRVTEADISNFEDEYRFSGEERGDVLQAFVQYEGNMSNVMDAIMLSTEDDEERFTDMIQKAIKNDEVAAFPKWREYLKAQTKKGKTKTTPAQQKRKQAKREKEAREAEELFNKIRGNQQKRSDGGATTALSAKR
ncbi:hypothetical protein BBJ28_00019979 [Nothophytophthora sp. Chile5]|nr:hypothetical protein BBJ28_00019979 [Nothophytophthora sp. Chile5]